MVGVAVVEIALESIAGVAVVEIPSLCSTIYAPHYTT